MIVPEYFPSTFTESSCVQSPEYGEFSFGFVRPGDPLEGELDVARLHFPEALLERDSLLQGEVELQPVARGLEGVRQAMNDLVRAGHIGEQRLEEALHVGRVLKPGKDGRIDIRHVGHRAPGKRLRRWLRGSGRASRAGGGRRAASGENRASASRREPENSRPGDELPPADAPLEQFLDEVDSLWPTFGEGSCLGALFRDHDPSPVSVVYRHLTSPVLDIQPISAHLKRERHRVTCHHQRHLPPLQDQATPQRRPGAADRDRHQLTHRTAHRPPTAQPHQPKPRRLPAARL